MISLDISSNHTAPKNMMSFGHFMLKQYFRAKPYDYPQISEKAEKTYTTETGRYRKLGGHPRVCKCDGNLHQCLDNCIQVFFETWPYQ